MTSRFISPQSKIKIITNLAEASRYMNLCLTELNKSGCQGLGITKSIEDLNQRIEDHLDSIFSNPIIAG